MDTTQDRINQPPASLPKPPGLSTPLKASPKQPPTDKSANKTIETDLPKGFVDASSDYTTAENDDTIVMLGHVKIRYEQYTITCGKAVYNETTQTLALQYNVILDTGSEVFTGERIALNLDTNEFYAQGSTRIANSKGGNPIANTDIPITKQSKLETTLSIERFQGNILQPLRIWGQSAERVGDILTFKDGFLTTCDVLPTPHFRVGFAQATVIPGKRIILRAARFYKNDRVILRIAYLVIPLVDQPRFSYLPYVGQTKEEGFFVKSALAYVVGKKLPGLFKLDLMQKKGVGLGVDQIYQDNKNAVGRVNFYGLDDRSTKQNTRNGGINHSQQFGQVRFDLNNTFQNNSYQSVSSNSRTNNTTINLVRREFHGYDSNVSYNLGSNSFSSSNGKNQSYTLSQVLPLQKTTETGLLSVGSVTLRYTGNRSDNTSVSGTQTSLSGRREENGDVQANANVGIVTVRLSANKNFVNQQISSSGSSSFFSGTERLPELELGFNTQKLHGLLRRIPTQIGIGYGRFLEGGSTFSSGSSSGSDSTVPQKITTNRFLITANPSSKTINLNPDRTLSFNIGGDFKQTIYPGSDAAQYVLANNTTLTKRFGASSGSNIALNYRYNRPYGGLPLNFRLDQSGTSNYLGLSSTAAEKRTQFSLFTGYDILRATEKQQFVTARNPWQNLTFQYGYIPQFGPLGERNQPRLQNRLSGTYDINSHRPQTFTNRFTIREGNFLFDTNTRYDPKTHKFPQIRGQLGTNVGRGMFLSALASYSQSTSSIVGQSSAGKFDYKTFTLTKTYHDYELTLRYQDQPFGFRANSDKGFSLNIRLKAFPSAQISTGGQFGTGFDTGLGDIY